jgi:hypothetical protein
MNDNGRWWFDFIYYRGCILCYNKLGPGLFESVYESTLCYELLRAGLDLKDS